jgi:hypothetical protein
MLAMTDEVFCPTLSLAWSTPLVLAEMRRCSRHRCSLSPNGLVTEYRLLNEVGIALRSALLSHPDNREHSFGETAELSLVDILDLSIPIRIRIVMKAVSVLLDVS